MVGGSQAEAQACLTEALQLQARHALYTAHAQAWAQLWADCGLEVEGPLALRQALRGALYYLLSALPQPGAPGCDCHGLSPGGLSREAGAGPQPLTLSSLLGPLLGLQAGERSLRLEWGSWAAAASVLL